MSLLAFNKTGSPLALAAGNVSVTLPASASAPNRGVSVNVTSELRGLTSGDYDDLQAQVVAGDIELEWTGDIAYDTKSLAVQSSAETAATKRFRYAPDNPQGNRGNVYTENTQAGWIAFVRAVQASLAAGFTTQMEFDARFSTTLAADGAKACLVRNSTAEPGGYWDLDGAVIVGRAGSLAADRHVTWEYTPGSEGSWKISKIQSKTRFVHSHATHRPWVIANQSVFNADIVFGPTFYTVGVSAPMFDIPVSASFADFVGFFGPTMGWGNVDTGAGLAAPLPSPLAEIDTFIVVFSDRSYMEENCFATGTGGGLFTYLLIRDWNSGAKQNQANTGQPVFPNLDFTVSTRSISGRSSRRNMGKPGALSFGGNPMINAAAWPAGYDPTLAEYLIYDTLDRAVTITSGEAETYALVDGQTLLVAVDGGGAATATFNTGDFAAIGAATAAEVAAVINTDVPGVTADGSSGSVAMTTDSVGEAAEVEVTGGTAAAAFNFAAGAANGTGPAILNLLAAGNLYGSHDLLVSDGAGKFGDNPLTVVPLAANPRNSAAADDTVEGMTSLVLGNAGESCILQADMANGPTTGVANTRKVTTSLILWEPAAVWSDTDVAASQTDAALSALSSVFAEKVMDRPGTIVGIMTQLSETLTAGTLTVTASINGTPVATFALVHDFDATLNLDGGTKQQAPYTTGSMFAKGDTVGFAITTTAGFTPVSTDLEVRMMCAA